MSAILIVSHGGIDVARLVNELHVVAEVFKEGVICIKEAFGEAANCLNGKLINMMTFDEYHEQPCYNIREKYPLVRKIALTSQHIPKIKRLAQLARSRL